MNIARVTPAGTKYLEHLPDGYDGFKEYPMIVFLAGQGERGSDINQVRKYGPPKLVDDNNRLVTGFIVISPQLETKHSDWGAEIQKELHGSRGLRSAARSGIQRHQVVEGQTQEGRPVLV